jgi:hypothetical protein
MYGGPSNPVAESEDKQSNSSKITFAFMQVYHAIDVLDTNIERLMGQYTGELDPRKDPGKEEKTIENEEKPMMVVIRDCPNDLEDITNKLNEINLKIDTFRDLLL